MNGEQSKVLENMLRQRRQFLSQGARGVAPVPVWFPEEPTESDLSTYPCDANTPNKRYRDAYHPLQPNPVSIPVGLVATQLARENKTRTQMFIVNADVVPLLVGFGFPPTLTNYSLPMAACAAANDGNGGIIIDSNFKGAIWVIVGANQLQNGTVLFNEIFDEGV